MFYQVGGARRRERGQTIILVSISLIALIAMSALAIDVTTLYVARSEAQRAANAAALAGAKVFTTSGFTSVQQGGAPTISSGDVCIAATTVGTTIAAQMTVAGRPAVAHLISCPGAGPALNPQITFSVSGTSPIFFARIWGRATNTIIATATAEAYNPSGRVSPILQVSVKPWLIPNCDVTNAAPAPPPPPGVNCGGYAPFVNTPAGTLMDGSVANNGASIGQPTPITVSKVIHRQKVCGATGKCPVNTTQYFPLAVPINPPSAICSSCAAGTDYSDNISCTSQYRMSCGETIGPGGTVGPFGTVIVENNNMTNLGPTATGATQCLIHAALGQDVFTPNGAGLKPTIAPGMGNPNPNFAGRTDISRSDSIITVPLYDAVTAGGPNPLNLCPVGGGACAQTATIVGFLQLGVTQSNANGTFQAVVLNIAGCSPPYPPASSPLPQPGDTAISGGGVSPVPVRLIGP